MLSLKNFTDWVFKSHSQLGRYLPAFKIVVRKIIKMYNTDLDKDLDREEF